MTWRELRDASIMMCKSHLDQEVVVMTINHDVAFNLKIERLDQPFVELGSAYRTTGTIKVQAGTPYLLEER